MGSHSGFLPDYISSCFREDERLRSVDDDQNRRDFDLLGFGKRFWIHLCVTLSVLVMTLGIWPQRVIGSYELTSFSQRSFASQLSSSYAALGDSYSSGQGNGSYYQGTNTPTDRCHRSPVAYDPELAAKYHVGSFSFVACSGAVTADLFASNHMYPSEPAQLTSLTTKTSAVTLTIGGNDVGFAQILAACVWGIGYGAPGCSHNPAVTEMVSYDLEALANLSPSCPTSNLPISKASSTPITSWLCVLLAIHEAAPNAVVDLVGYPQLFANFSDPTCQVGSLDGFYPLFVSSSDARWLNSVALEGMNDEKAAVAAAQKMGVPAIVTDVNQVFYTHRFCDSAKLFFHPLTLTTSFFGTVASPGSMHPNSDGVAAYVSAIEQSVAKR